LVIRILFSERFVYRPGASFRRNDGHYRSGRNTHVARLFHAIVIFPQRPADIRRAFPYTFALARLRCR
jgi:hypothetical protein